MQRQLPSLYSTSFISNQLAVHREDPAPLGEIKADEIKYSIPLDSGSSSTIFRSKYKQEEVVIKQYIISPKHSLAYTQSKLKNEWNVLKACFPSQYIVKPIAYCMKPPFIVMEYLSNGALDYFLLKKN